MPNLKTMIPLLELSKIVTEYLQLVSIWILMKAIAVEVGSW